MTFYCSSHRDYLPLSSFYPSSIRNGETRCKTCSNNYRLVRRQRDPIRLLQWKMYQSEHRYCGGESAYPSKDEVQAIVQKCGGKSVLGEGEGELCIVRMDPDLPLHENPWNAALVTSQQSRHLPRIREKRLLAFSNKSK